MNHEKLDTLRLPPHSVHAEQAVLGSLLRDNNAWDRIAGRVSAGDFYRQEHRRVFSIIERLIGSDKPADVLTVFEQLEKSAQAGDLLTLPFLDTLARSENSTANIARHADTVRNRRILRDLITTANDICERAYETQDEDVRALLNSAEKKILGIARVGAQSNGNAVHVNDLMIEVIEELDARCSSEEWNLISGLPTGIIDLDRITSGLQPGELVVIAGRPSMGKTALAVTIGQNVANEAELPVLIFTLETQAKQLTQRIICSTAGIDTQRLRTANILDEDWALLTRGIQKLNEKPLYIDDSPRLTQNELVSRARRFDRQHGKAGLIIVDYLQLLAYTHNESVNPETRASTIGAITRSLKNLAKELNCPIIALSQVNRGVESRPNKRPVLSDLRDAGAIEEDADMILFVYRDEIYNPDSPDRGMAEIIIAKQRNGPAGSIRTIFQGNTSKFENYKVRS